MLDRPPAPPYRLGMSIQPSEMTKLVTIVWVAYWGSQKQHIQMHGWRELAKATC